MHYFYNPIALALLLISFASFNSGCAETKSSSDSLSTMEEEAAIKAVLTEMWAAIENEDVEKYASFVHPDFTQFGESDPSLNIGKEVEVAGIREWLKNASNIHTEMIDPIVEIKGEVAWILYYWQDEGITNDEAFSSRGKSTRIFVKENGKWLCIHGHYTLLP